ncbi:hypothetical protein ONZ45_g15519 [Pleurotus djamor]|nr:hypothetical protein ONZ45_g15519 [Pleurotus djamor]
MSCSFLSLPTEILIRILLHVPARHLLTCTQLNRYISNIIKDAAILQYTIEAYFAGAQVLDGSDYDKLTKSSLADRLDRLKKREAAWRSFRPDFRERIEVPHVASGIYDLSGCIYLLGESGDSRSTTTALRYLTLPEHMFDEAKWQRINLQKQIVDIGLSIYEHDLMAVVTSTPDRADFSYVSIELTLLQLSTSNHHPLAKQPIISCVQTTLGGTRLAVSIEIVGRYLALVITFHAPFFAQSNDPKDRFLVFDWKEGKQLLVNDSSHIHLRMY